MNDLDIKKILFKNTSFQMISNVLSLIIGLLTAMVLSRHLGVENYGRYQYVFAFYYFFLFFSNFGIDSIVVRESSKNKENASNVIGAALSLKFCLTGICLLVGWIAIWTMKYDYALRNALIVYSIILPIHAAKLPAIIFQVVLKMEYPAIIGFLHKILNFLLIVAVVFIGEGIFMLALAIILGEVAHLAVLLFFSRRFVASEVNWNFDLWKKIMKSALPLGVAGVFVAITNRADFIMLEKMTSIAELGLYSAAYRVIGMLEAFPLMVMATVYPLMSRYAENDFMRLKRIYYKSLAFFSVLAIPMGLGVTYFSLLITRILFGEAFVNAASSLSVLIWSSVFLYLAITGGNLLISIGREKYSLWIHVISAISNVVLNFILIPMFGAVGAALATVISFGIIFILTTGLVAYEFRRN